MSAVEHCRGKCVRELFRSHLHALEAYSPETDCSMSEHVAGVKALGISGFCLVLITNPPGPALMLLQFQALSSACEILSGNVQL